MWLPVPDKIEKVLWEGSMELATAGSRKQMARVEEYTEIDVRQLPIVSIGQPEVWHLKEVYSAEKMPPLLKAKSDESDFYLVPDRKLVFFLKLFPSQESIVRFFEGQEKGFFLV